MLVLEGLNLHAAGIRALAGRRTTPVKLGEAGLLVAHIGGYLAAVFLVLSPLQAVAFVALHQGLFGVYLGASFAPTTRACTSSARTTRSISCAARS